MGVFLKKAIDSGRFVEVIFNLGMVSPSLPVAITAQVFMGTTFVYSCKWSTEPLDGLDGWVEGKSDTS